MIIKSLASSRESEKHFVLANEGRVYFWWFNTALRLFYLRQPGKRRILMGNVLMVPHRDRSIIRKPDKYSHCSTNATVIKLSSLFCALSHHIMYFFCNNLLNKNLLPRKRVPRGTAGNTEHKQSSARGKVPRCCSQSSPSGRSRSYSARTWRWPGRWPCCCGGEKDTIRMEVSWIHTNEIKSWFSWIFKYIQMLSAKKEMQFSMYLSSFEPETPQKCNDSFKTF